MMLWPWRQHQQLTWLLTLHCPTSNLKVSDTDRMCESNLWQCKLKNLLGKMLQRIWKKCTLIDSKSSYVQKPWHQLSRMSSNFVQGSKGTGWRGHLIINGHKCHSQVRFTQQKVPSCSLHVRHCFWMIAYSAISLLSSIIYTQLVSGRQTLEILWAGLSERQRACHREAMFMSCINVLSCTRL